MVDLGAHVTVPHRPTGRSLRMTLDSNFVDVWAYPICCTAGMQNDTLSRDAFQEEQNTTYHFAARQDLEDEKYGRIFFRPQMALKGQQGTG